MKTVRFNLAMFRPPITAKKSAQRSALITSLTRISSFSIPAIVVAVAASTASPTAFAQPIVGNKDNAISKVAMCVGCHAIPGYKSSFPTVYSVPKIGGQSAKYIENALQAYKKGDRSHPSMRGIAGSLTDQDMADLAAFYGADKAKN